MSHFGFGGQRCKTVCPKCRGNSLHLSEVWGGNGIYFSVENGVMPHDADDHFQGGPTRVFATCMNPGCGHEWRVRGVRSVADMVKEQQS